MLLLLAVQLCSNYEVGPRASLHSLSFNFCPGDKAIRWSLWAHCAHVSLPLAEGLERKWSIVWRDPVYEVLVETNTAPPHCL